MGGSSPPREARIKKVLLALLVIVTGGYGGIGFVTLLLFRLEPPELQATQVVDIGVGLSLGFAIIGLLNFFELPRARVARLKLSLAAGIAVCVLAGGSLISLHRYTLAVRDRDAKAADQRELQQRS